MQPDNAFIGDNLGQFVLKSSYFQCHVSFPQRKLIQRDQFSKYAVCADLQRKVSNLSARTVTPRENREEKILQKLHRNTHYTLALLLSSN